MMVEAALFFAGDGRPEDGVVGITTCHRVLAAGWGGVEADDLCRRHATILQVPAGGVGLLAWLK
jgi:hypothetical protein